MSGVVKATIELIGECNQCGLCCETVIAGVPVRCENLVLNRDVNGINPPTYCKVYKDRYNRMPINMVSLDGKVVIPAWCAKDDPEETWAIVERGMGKGCSLKLKMTKESSSPSVS